MDALKKKKYNNQNKYRDPRIYKVTDGTEIWYLNEKQINDKETQQQIEQEKIRLIEIFKNEK